jgi:hypothetical protein
MREICMSGSMSGVWRRSHGRATKAPPNERGGNSYARPNATAPHLDSTKAPFSARMTNVRSTSKSGAKADILELGADIVAKVESCRTQNSSRKH